MSYYLEYVIPAGPDEGNFEFPVSEEHRGYTVPLTETDAEVVRTDQLPARTEVFGASLDEAKEAAESILANSKADKAELYEDPDDSMQPGSGTLVASYTQGGSWQDVG
jgi:hypothetical protein